MDADQMIVYIYSESQKWDFLKKKVVLTCKMFYLPEM